PQSLLFTFPPLPSSATSILSLHDALPILHAAQLQRYFVAGIDVEILSFSAAAAEKGERFGILPQDAPSFALCFDALDDVFEINRDRKSTRLNSSHEWISYAVFCLKKKKLV